MGTIESKPRKHNILHSQSLDALVVGYGVVRSCPQLPARFVAHGVLTENHRLERYEDLEKGGVVGLPRLAGPCIEKGEADYGMLCQ